MFIFVGLMRHISNHSYVMLVYGIVTSIFTESLNKYLLITYLNVNLLDLFLISYNMLQNTMLQRSIKH